MHGLYQATAECKPSAHAPLGKTGLCFLSAGVTWIFSRLWPVRVCQMDGLSGKWKCASLAHPEVNSLGLADLLLMFCLCFADALLRVADVLLIPTALRHVVDI